MSTEEHKAVVRRFFEAFETNDQIALREVLAPDVVVYLPGEAGPVGRDVLLDLIGRWGKAFSDLRAGIEHQVAERDVVATHLTLRAVHDRGDFLDLPPTGRRFSIDVMTLERIEGGRIVERRVVFDLLALMHQLGGSAPPQ